MKEIYDDYLNNKIKLDNISFLSLISFIIVISGMIGWIYEFIFYYFDQGMDKFYFQGGNFLPWINIYAYGALIVWFLTYRYKKNPVKVFLVSCLSTGLLEYISGYFILKLLHVRYWDYNKEILNFGNIDGFICLRSVLLFGIACLFLVYFVIPLLYTLYFNMNKKVFIIIGLSLVSIVLIDEIYNLIFTKVFDLPSAEFLYKKLGFHYMN